MGIYHLITHFLFTMRTFAIICAFFIIFQAVRAQIEVEIDPAELEEHAMATNEDLDRTILCCAFGASRCTTSCANQACTASCTARCGLLRVCSAQLCSAAAPTTCVAAAPATPAFPPRSLA